MRASERAMKVTPSSASTNVSPRERSVILSHDDASLARELVAFAVESVASIIAHEETYGNRAPILRTLKRYRERATALLARIA